MTATTKTAMTTEISTNFADNTTGNVTAVITRTMLQDLVDSSIVGPKTSKYTKNTTSGATTAAAGDLTGALAVFAEYSAVGANNLTTRTAAQMFTDAGNVQAGDTYWLRIINSSGGTTTLVAGTNVTLTGTMTMATQTWREFLVTFTDSTHLTIQSVGTGTNS